MKNLLKRFNILIFALSLIMAVVLWGYVSFYVNPTGEKTIRNIPVTFTNESSLETHNLIMVSDRNLTVDVLLSGRNQDFSDLNESNLQAVADLSLVRTAGEQSINYELRAVTEMTAHLASLDKTYYTSSNTPVITITTDELATKTIPIELAEKPGRADEHMVEAEVIDPSNITVRGPSKVVNTIEKGLLNYTSNEPLSATVEGDYGYTLYTKDGELTDTRFLTFDYEQVWLRIPVSKIKTVPLDMTFIDGGGITKEKNILLSINPVSVQISGDPSELDRINTVMLAATINLAELTGDISGTYQIQFPDNVRNVDNVTEAQVSIKIVNAETQQITTSNILVTGDNLPEGYRYILNTTYLTITIRGSREDVNAVRPHNIRVTADFGETPLTPGVSMAVPEITIDGFGSVGVVDMEYAVFIEVVPIVPDDTGGDAP